MKVGWIFCILIVMSSTGSWSGGGHSGDSAIMAAREDLANRLGIPLEKVVVVSQTEKTWPDRSMGCPRADMAYAQVITNGSQLVLKAAGQQYVYHSGRGRPYFYCAAPAKKSGGPNWDPAA